MNRCIPNRDMEITSVIKKKSGIEAVDLAGEKVITDFNAGNYYMLTGVGGVIWNMLEKEITPEQIIKNLLAEYDVDEETCKADVMEYLNEVEKLGYIEVA